MQVEPPGPDVPAPGDEASLGPLRLSAALAAVVLALAGEGHVLVLGALVAVVVGTPAGGVAALLAALAVLVRWGSPALSAAAGGQDVLGPAIMIGSTASAASGWLAAAAIVLAVPTTFGRAADPPAEPGARRRGEPLRVPRRRRALTPSGVVVAATTGVVAGAFVAGPTLPGGIVVRLAGIVGCGAVALAMSVAPLFDVRRTAALVAGVAAVALAAAG